MFATILVAIITSNAPSGVAVRANAALPNDRQAAVLVDHGAIERGETAIQISPVLADGQFWSFGDAFKRSVFYDCGEGIAPSWIAGATNQLSCTQGSPRLRPDITWPDNAAAFPNANIPPVRPGGRPVTQGLHFLLGWASYGLVALLCFLLGSWFANHMATRAPPISSPSPLPHLQRTDWIWLCALTGLGLGLRLINIGDEPFEQNEFTYYMSGFGHDSVLGVLLDVNAMAQTHPPLPHLILWLIEPLGNDEIWARLPQALFGAATLPLIYRLTWNTTDGHRTAAIVATLAAAVSSVHVWYSQDVSPYTITTFFAALTLLGGQGALRNPDNRRAWWCWIIGSWGLVYTHYYGLHLSFGIVLAVLILCTRKTKNRRRLFWRTISAGCKLWVGIIPWVPAFAQAYLWSRSHSTAYQRTALVYHPTQDFLADIIDTIRLVGGFPVALSILALLCLAIGAIHLPFRQIKLRDKLLLAVPVLWFVPFELINRATFLRGLYDGYYFGIRYFLFLFPIAWVAAGWCVHSASLKSTKQTLKWVTYAAATVSIVLSSWESVRHLTEREKPDVLSAARLVKSHLQDGDAVLVGPAAFYHHPFHYYFADPQVRSRLGINALMRTPAWQPLLSQIATVGPSRPLWLGVLSDLFEPYEKTLRSTHIRRVWVVDHKQRLLDRPEFSDRPSAAIQKVVSSHFKPTYKRDFHDVAVQLFERTQNAIPAPETIHFGWSDGPFVRAMEPPWAYVGPGRRIRLGSQIRLPYDAKQPVTKLTLRLGATPPGGYSAAASATVLPTTVRIMAGRQRLASFDVSDFVTKEIPIPASLQNGPLVLTVDRDAPTSMARPPEIVLDRMDIEYRDISEGHAEP